MLSMILTVAKDLFDSLEQPTILHIFVADNCDTSIVHGGLDNITLTQVSFMTILWCEHGAFCKVEKYPLCTIKR
jgi:hypothetical protein